MSSPRTHIIYHKPEQGVLFRYLLYDISCKYDGNLRRSFWKRVIRLMKHFELSENDTLLIFYTPAVAAVLLYGR
jgi:hypothetical protein